MSTYMTLEEYAAMLKVGDEVTIKYYSITGEKEIMELMNEVLNAYAKADFRFAHALNVFQGLIDKAPTVEERKHRHWIELEPDKYGNFIQCSVCDSKFGLYSKDNYCQACGAKMENNGDDDDE